VKLVSIALADCSDELLVEGDAVGADVDVEAGGDVAAEEKAEATAAATAAENAAVDAEVDAASILLDILSRAPSEALTLVSSPSEAWASPERGLGCLSRADLTNSLYTAHLCAL